MTALSFSAICGLEGESGVALPANFLIAIELLGDGTNSGIHGSSS